MRLYGNSVTVAASFALLDHHRGCFNLTVRNNVGNDPVYISNDGTTVIGFLLAGEAKTWQNMSPNNIYVKGTVGQTVFWDGDGQ